MYYLQKKLAFKIINVELDPDLFKLLDKIEKLEWVVDLNAKEIKEQEQIKEQYCAKKF